MSAQYDIEALLADVKTFLVANLNTKLTEIDTEKNDGITLDQFDTAAFFTQWLGSEVANYNPACVFGVDTVSVTSAGPASAKRFTLQVLVLFSDQANDPSVVTRLFRYQRAVVDIFAEKWGRITRDVDLSVSGLLPVDFVTLGYRHSPDRIIGVNFELVLP